MFARASEREFGYSYCGELKCSSIKSREKEVRMAPTLFVTPVKQRNWVVLLCPTFKKSSPRAIICGVSYVFFFIVVFRCSIQAMIVSPFLEKVAPCARDLSIEEEIGSLFPLDYSVFCTSQVAFLHIIKEIFGNCV